MRYFPTRFSLIVLAKNKPHRFKTNKQTATKHSGVEFSAQMGVGDSVGDRSTCVIQGTLFSLCEKQLGVVMHEVLLV